MSDADTTPAADSFIVDFTTSKGAFAMEVNPSWAPNGAARFRELVVAGFYDDARFFRVLTGFVVQWGINGTPATNAMWSNSTIKDDPVVKSNTRGYVSFAQTALPDSRTTQLFVNLANNARLDSRGFTPVGRVIDGLNRADAFYGGYGDGPPSGKGPDQDRMAAEGNEYLIRNYPRLDYVREARIVRESGSRGR